MTEPPTSTQLPPRLRLGQLLATPAAVAALSVAGVSVFKLLNRHARGDWGDLSEENHQQNNLAAMSGQRVLSSYLLSTGQKVWVVTEWDRSMTTVLLPDDY
ncbi:plasmid related protein [Ralstonia solanacearum]|nr:plasmid related protein [Ralstonia solanacearum]